MKLIRRLLMLGCSVVAMLILVILVSGIFLPSQWDAKATATSSLSPQELWPLISDFHRWNEWIGWDDEIYGVRSIEIEGEAATTGHNYSWSSQGSNGSLTITRAEQNVGIWYSGAIESDTPNAEGSITIEVLSDGSSKIIWSDKGDLPPLTGLLAIWLNSSLGAKFAEDLHRLSQLEPSDAGGR